MLPVSDEERSRLTGGTAHTEHEHNAVLAVCWRTRKETRSVIVCPNTTANDTLHVRDVPCLGYFYTALQTVQDAFKHPWKAEESSLVIVTKHKSEVQNWTENQALTWNFLTSSLPTLKPQCGTVFPAARFQCHLPNDSSFHCSFYGYLKQKGWLKNLCWEHPNTMEPAQGLSRNAS